LFIQPKEQITQMEPVPVSRSRLDLEHITQVLEMISNPEVIGAQDHRYLLG
jgi:hypothetical protein